MVPELLVDVANTTTLDPGETKFPTLATSSTEMVTANMPFGIAKPIFGAASVAKKLATSI